MASKAKPVPCGIARPEPEAIYLTFDLSAHASWFAEWWAGPGGRAFARSMKPKKPKKPRAKAVPLPRPRDPLFDAVAFVTGVDPATAGPHVAKVAAALRSSCPPYAPYEVEQFGREFHRLCPWGSDRRPTPGEVQKYIGLIRVAPPLSKAGRAFLDATGGR